MLELLSPEILIATMVLILLEVVLGIDNIVFIAIVTQKLPSHQQKRARILGLSLAMFARLALLFSMTWVITLSQPLFSLFNFSLSGRDIFLILGGGFLIYKGISELLEFSYAPHSSPNATRARGFAATIFQIIFLDIVFSIDSVVSAIGFLQGLSITHGQILFLASFAIIFTVILMLFSSGFITNFIVAHPSLKILALLFLALIGVTLVCEGLAIHIPKAYIYAALGFAGLFESINLYKKSRVKK